MTQPTRQFVPVQRDAAPRQGEAQFDLSPAHSNLTNNILTFAQQHNVANMQEAKAALYLEGQIQASQGKGVEELRANTPWYQKMFGHGATVSGAMDYTVQKAVFDYGNSVDENMDAHRKMTPEAFVAQQTGQIERYMGEDGPTNTAIYNAMSQALPDAARKQAKAFKGYEQELMVHSMSGAIAAGLTSVNKAQQGDADDRVAAVSAFGTVLAKHPGMTDEAYKNTLFNMAALEATEYGTGMLTDRIEDLGYARTPEERAQLLKVREVAEGKMVENSAVQIAFMKERLTSLAASETPMVNIMQEFDDARDIYGNSAFGEANVSKILSERAKYIGDSVITMQQQQANEAFVNGQGNSIVDDKMRRLAMEASRTQATQTGDWAGHFKALNESGLKDVVVERMFGTAFGADPAIDPETKLPTASRGQEEVIQRLQDLEVSFPAVYKAHVDENLATQMEVYNSTSDPSQTVGQRMAFVRGVMSQWGDDLKRTRDEQDIVSAALDDVMASPFWKFGEKDAKNEGYIRAQMDSYLRSTYRVTGGDMTAAVAMAQARFEANHIRTKYQYVPKQAAIAYELPEADFKGVLSTAMKNAGIDEKTANVHYHPQTGYISVLDSESNEMATLDMYSAAEDYHREKEVQAAKAAEVENKKQLVKYVSSREGFGKQYIRDTPEFKAAWEGRAASQQLMEEDVFFRNYWNAMTTEEKGMAAQLGEIGGYSGMGLIKTAHHAVANVLRDARDFLKNPYKDAGQQKVVLTAEQRQGLSQSMITPSTIQGMLDVTVAQMEADKVTEEAATNAIGGHLKDPTPREQAMYTEGLRRGTAAPAGKAEWELLPTEEMTPVERNLYRHEAAVRRVYGDSVGVPTIGVGAAIAAEHVSPATKEFFKAEFGFGDEMFPPKGGDFSGWKDVRLDDGQMLRLFRANLDHFRARLKSSYKDPLIQDALIPIVYQTGLGSAVGTGGGAWKAGQHLRAGIKSGKSEDYQNAIAEYINSDWYRTYPRAKEAVRNLMQAIGTEHFS